MDTHQATLNKAADLREQLAKVEAELAVYAELTDAQKLAEEIHARTCIWNHTDGCSWFYEKTWQDWTHAQYLTRAEKVLERHNLPEALDLLHLLHDSLI